MTSPGLKYWPKLWIAREDLKEFICVISTEPADVLALSGARTSAGTVMINFCAHIYTGSALQRVNHLASHVFIGLSIELRPLPVTCSRADIIKSKLWQTAQWPTFQYRIPDISFLFASLLSRISYASELIDVHMCVWLSRHIVHYAYHSLKHEQNGCQ